MQLRNIRIGKVVVFAIAALAIVLVGAALASTSGGDEEQPARCLAAPITAQRIAEGLTVDGVGALADAQAVRSDDFESVYFVAAEIDGPGIEEAGDVGVWVTNDLDTGLIFSVNGFANEFSDWGNGRDTDARFSMSDDGAEAARDCVAR